MVKPEWGVKRTCLSCSAKFYDMKRDPVVCPKCGAVLDIEALSKPRRSRAAPVAEPKPPKAAAKRAQKVRRGVRCPNVAAGGPYFSESRIWSIDAGVSFSW